MKKSISLLLTLFAIINCNAQTIAEMALQQIEKEVKLPIIVALIDSSYIRTLNLDKVIMQLPLSPSGRVKVSKVKFINPSITQVNERFIAAVKKVRLPKESISKGDTLTIGIQIAFEDINYTPEYDARHSETLHYPNVNQKIKFYEQQMMQRLERSCYFGRPTNNTRNQARQDAISSLSYSTYSQSKGGTGLPRFRVLLTDNK